jgi:microcystin-dependent protein
MGAQPFLGEIQIWPANFAPRGWAFCDGSTLAISQNDALFALLGTTYGGDGVNTFQLPDLRGRVPIHQGQGPGLSNRIIGESSGVESVTLTTNQFPAHSHAPQANSSASTAASPTGAVWAAWSGAQYTDQAPTGGRNAAAAGAAGGGQPHDNMSPFTAVNYIIALEGVFPSRN